MLELIAIFARMSMDLRVPLPYVMRCPAYFLLDQRGHTDQSMGQRLAAVRG